MTNRRVGEQPKPARHWCSCGRGFYNRAGMLNHGHKCPIETARSAAFILAVEEGRSPLADPAACVQLPRLSATGEPLS